MDWKFVYYQLTKNSILRNFRVVLFFSQKKLKQRYGTDHFIIATPILIAILLTTRKYINDENVIWGSILFTILVTFLAAHFLIKRNEKKVLIMYPEIHTLLDSKKKEFFLIWGIFVLLFYLICALWYLILVYFAF
jgi:hypothetical protein